MKIPLLFRVLIASLAITAAGCGGSGGGGVGTSPTGDQIIFNNGHTGTVSETARMNDVSTITQVVTTNPSVTAGQMAQLVVAKMKTITDFREGGISTSGDPWGEFKDGSLYLVNVSDPEFFGLSSSTISTKPAARGLVSKALITTRTNGATTVFPGSTKAYIIYGVEAYRTSPSTQLAGELTQAGYSVTLTTGGVADWSQISGAGILVNDGHGTTARGKFYVSTTDVETPALDKQYASSIASEAMIVAGVEVFDSSGEKHIEQRYLLSIDYLKTLPNYSSMFSQDSLFMNVVCSGDSTEAANFWEALQTGAGLGDYAGWSKPVLEGAATQTAVFFFDQVLGLNQAAPVDPSLPPPGAVAATAALLAKTPRGAGSSTNMNQDGPDNLLSFHFHANLNYIIPSVFSVAPSSDGSKWQVAGAFGSDTGTASFGGRPVTPLSWTDSEIDIPAQSTSGAVVVKTPAGLISNAYTSLGKPTLTPLSSKIQQGANQVLRVTVGDGLKGDTYSYKWTNSATYGSIADASGHKVPTFTSSDNSVTYSPSPNLYGTDTITVQTFAVQIDGTMVSLGKATATIEVAPSGTLSISPPEANIDQTQKQSIMVSVNGGVAGATYSYNWTNTANFGAMADANGHSGPSFTSLLAAVTYVPKGSDGTDTVSVEVFVVAADKTLHRLGTEHCTVSVSVRSLIFTPSDTTLAVSQSQVFTVAPVTGSFPSGSSFVWELVGKGSINGSRNVTTAAPQVTFKAPSVIGAASLDLTVKNSKGAAIATGGILITIVQVAISPNSVTFNGPGQTSSFSVNGRFPSGTTYMWSCTSGGLSTTGTSTPFPKTLTTSTPRVTYFVANPPADGSPATDTLSVTVSGPTGTSLGSESATILYGGTPFFTATYPNKNNKIVTRSGLINV